MASTFTSIAQSLKVVVFLYLFVVMLILYDVLCSYWVG